MLPLELNSLKNTFSPPAIWVWYALLVVGKFVDVVDPERYTFPALSIATLFPESVLFPPRYVLYIRLPLELNSLKNASYPPPFWVWYALLVVGKFVDDVLPVMYIFPFLPTVIEYP